jgi:hypothetical protein
MTKITIKPSEEIVAQAVKPVVVTDARGRALTLRKPNVLSQFRLVKMLGDSARNTAYMAMITPLTYLTQIDDEAIAPPTTERELEALIQRLDDDGVMAIMEGLQANYASQSVDDREAALKN